MNFNRAERNPLLIDESEEVVREAMPRRGALRRLGGLAARLAVVSPCWARWSNFRRTGIGTGLGIVESSEGPDPTRRVDSHQNRILP